MSFWGLAISKQTVKDFREFILNQFRYIVSVKDGKTRLNKAVYNKSLINNKDKFNEYFPNINFKLIRGLLEIFNKETDLDMFKGFAKFYAETRDESSKKDVDALLNMDNKSNIIDYIKAKLESDGSMARINTNLCVLINGAVLISGVLNPFIGLLMIFLLSAGVSKTVGNMFEVGHFSKKMKFIVNEIDSGKTPENLDFNKIISM